MKMIEILKELMEELRQKGQIPTNQTLIEENLLVTDLLLSELFDPANAYEYLEHGGIYYYMDREVDQLAELLVPIAEESKSKDQEISDLNDQLDEKDDKITDLKDALKSLAEDVKAKVAEAILGL
jgi:peptidoglycan hydrolase CwlO-like protein